MQNTCGIPLQSIQLFLLRFTYDKTGLQFILVNHISISGDASYLVLFIGFIISCCPVLSFFLSILHLTGALRRGTHDRCIYDQTIVELPHIPNGHTGRDKTKKKR